MAARIEELLETEGSRAAVLLELARRVPESFLDDLLTAARRLEDPLRRFLVLQALAERATGQLKEEIISRAGAAVRGIQDPAQRAIADLALRDPEEVPLGALVESLGAVRSVTDPLLRTRLLDRLMGKGLRLRQARAATDVPHAFDSFLALTREMAVQSVSGEQRSGPVAREMAQLGAEFLRRGGDLSAAQSREALERTGSIDDEGVRATLLAGMARVLAPEFRVAGLAAARRLHRQEARARALVGFVPVMEASRDLQVEVAREALSSARSIGHWNTQAAAYRSLNVSIPDPTVGDALSTELELRRASVRTRALASLSGRLDLAQLDRVVESTMDLPPDPGKLRLLEAAQARVRGMDDPRAQRLARSLEAPLAEAVEERYSLLRSPAASAFTEPRRLSPEDLSMLREAAIRPLDEDVATLIRRDPATVAEMVSRRLVPFESAAPPEREPSTERPAEGNRGGEKAAAAPEFVDAQAWPTVPQHVVSTGFSDPASPADPRAADRPLPQNGDFLFWLEIGAPVAGAIDETPTELPVDLLPPDAVLDVVLLSNDPGLDVVGTTRGQVAFLEDGSIRVRTPAHVPDRLDAGDPLLERRLFFAVHTPPGVGEYRLRCGIYFRNVLVQSREVSLRVGGAPSDGPALVTRVDYSLSRSLSPAHLRSYEPHRLSVVMNRASDGSHNFHFVGEGELATTATFDSHEVQDYVTRLRAGLRQASWGSDGGWDSEVSRYRYGKAVQFDQLFVDLHRLAQAGFRTYDVIAERLGGGPAGADLLRDQMRRPGVVQLALRDSARMVVPLALLYDFPLDAQLPVESCSLCSQFLRDVGAGSPLHEHACFRGECPTYDDDTVVCPAGFWGFRHALGVPLSLIGEGDSPSEIPSLLEPADVVQMLVAVCTDPQFRRRIAHVESLRGLLPPNQVHLADTRDGTLEGMRSVEAQVLYFYCHGGVSQNTPYIQVGALSEPGIERSTLRQKGIRWSIPRPRPLVFVNGCHTVDVEPEVAIEMVSGFVRRAGASAVIGTEITIFEQLAVDFAERFLRVFLLERRTMGEAIRRARLSILQKQLNPLGLVYVPFGLASLRLADS